MSFWDSKAVLKWAKEVLTIEADGIICVRDKLDESFVEAVNLALNCSGRIVTTGIGKSGIIAKKVSATLSSLGTPSFFIHPVEALHGDLGMVLSKDVVIVFSNSGETEEVCNLASLLKGLGIKIIAFTGNRFSTLAKLSDVVIDVSVPREACHLGVAPTASTTSALAMGDALAVVLTRVKNFSLKDFRTFHPNGYIGQRLRVPVAEIMRRGEEIPIVKPDDCLRDVVEEMNRKGLGATLVMSSNILVGIFTDGDLRRAITRWDTQVWEKKAREVMTPSPKFIEIGSFVSDALELMEKHLITVLPVVDNDGSVVGIVHLHDLLGKGKIQFRLTE